MKFGTQTMFIRSEFCEISTAHDFIKGICKVYTKKMKIPQYSIERQNGGKLIFANSVRTGNLKSQQAQLQIRRKQIFTAGRISSDSTI